MRPVSRVEPPPILIIVGILTFVAFDRDPQGAQEVDVRGRERLTALLIALHALDRDPDARLIFDFIQTDGRLQHQQHIEALLANILDDAGDVLRFGDTLVDRLSQLLDQLSQLLIQLGCPQFLPAERVPAATLDLSTLRSMSMLCKRTTRTQERVCSPLINSHHGEGLDMRSKTLGRAVGIGLRRAGSKLIEPRPPEPEEAVAAKRASRQAEIAAKVQATGDRSRRIATGVGRGTGNFARAVWNPFALATGVLWLEITGAFFALFALFFAQHLYEHRDAWAANQPGDRRHLILYVGLLAMFTYFSLSSFYRARRKQKRARQP